MNYIILMGHWDTPRKNILNQSYTIFAGYANVTIIRTDSKKLIINDLMDILALC